MFNKRARKRTENEMENSVMGSTLPHTKPTHDKGNVSGWSLLFRWVVIGYIVAAGVWLGLTAVTSIH